MRYVYAEHKMEPNRYEELGLVFGEQINGMIRGYAQARRELYHAQRHDVTDEQIAVLYHNVQIMQLDMEALFENIRENMEITAESEIMQYGDGVDEYTTGLSAEYFVHQQYTGSELLERFEHMTALIHDDTILQRQRDALEYNLRSIKIAMEHRDRHRA